MLNLPLPLKTSVPASTLRQRLALRAEGARLAADALRTRIHAVRRADRLGSRSRPHTVAVPAASRSRLRSPRTDRKAGRVPEQATDVAAMDQTRATFEAAAKIAAKLTDGVRDRAIASGPRPQPTATTTSPTLRLPKSSSARFQTPCRYSWRMPPSRWRRRMSRWVICSGSPIGIGKGRNGRALAMP